MKNLSLIISCLFLFSILSGCLSTSGTTEIPTNDGNNNVINNDLLTATITPAPTASRSPSQTPYPVVPNNPEPTLPTSDAITTIQTLLTTNGGCDYPCFWGITPGLSQWSDALGILYPISSEIHYNELNDSREFMEISLQGEEENYSIQPEIEFRVENGLVTQVYFQTRQSITEFLEEHGIPEDIWFVFSEFYPLSPGYSIHLLYPSLGLSIWFFDDIGAHYSTIEGIEYFEVCPDNVQNVNSEISLWDPSDHSIYNDVINLISTRNNPRAINIQESANMGIDSFYANFLDLFSGECLRMVRTR